MGLEWTLPQDCVGLKTREVRKVTQFNPHGSLWRPLQLPLYCKINCAESTDLGHQNSSIAY